MNDEITVMTIDDKDYVVLEKILKDVHEYLILFEEENPKNILLVEYYKNASQIEEIENNDLKIMILEEFFKRHPDLKQGI